MPSILETMEYQLTVGDVARAMNQDEVFRNAFEDFRSYWNEHAEEIKEFYAEDIETYNKISSFLKSFKQFEDQFMSSRPATYHDMLRYTHEINISYDIFEKHKTMRINGNVYNHLLKKASMVIETYTNSIRVWQSMGNIA